MKIEFVRSFPTRVFTSVSREAIFADHVNEQLYILISRMILESRKILETPLPSCESRSNKQWALALTTVRLMARRTSPITLPNMPSPASHPCARLIAATQDSANARRSLWK